MGRGGHRMAFARSLLNEIGGHGNILQVSSPPSEVFFEGSSGCVVAVPLADGKNQEHEGLWQAIAAHEGAHFKLYDSVTQMN